MSGADSGEAAAKNRESGGKKKLAPLVVAEVVAEVGGGREEVGVLSFVGRQRCAGEGKERGER